MDIVELPVVALSCPLRDAFEAMKSRRRSAVVGVHSGERKEYFLFTAPDIVHQLARGGGTLDDVSRRSRVAEAPALSKMLGIGTIGAAPEPSSFDATGGPYALVSTAANTAAVVTRHKWLAAALSAKPGDCYCDGPFQHECSGPSGSKCTYCSEGTVVCDKP